MRAISFENKDIVIRFSKDLVSKETLMRLLDYIELESLRKRSSLTKEDVEVLADEINQAAWAKIKHQFLGEQKIVGA